MKLSEFLRTHELGFHRVYIWGAIRKYYMLFVNYLHLAGMRYANERQVRNDMVIF